jgi:hypothetical protein
MLSNMGVERVTLPEVLLHDVLVMNDGSMFSVIEMKDGEIFTYDKDWNWISLNWDRVVGRLTNAL